MVFQAETPVCITNTIDFKIYVGILLEVTDSCLPQSTYFIQVTMYWHMGETGKNQSKKNIKIKIKEYSASECVKNSEVKHNVPQ
uniref:Uncharacterized protein n=1 Tax=Rhizophora mucronata TaxID=61149 RepID=A0A2P2IZ89_RHIMU